VIADALELASRAARRSVTAMSSERDRRADPHFAVANAFARREAWPA